MEYPQRDRLNQPDPPTTMQSPPPLLVALSTSWTVVPWAAEHLPAWLQTRWLWGVPLWQWLGLVLLIAVCIPAGRALRALAQAVLGRFVRRTPVRWDDLLHEKLRGPFGAAVTLGLFAMLVPFLGFGELARGRIRQVLAVGVLAVFFSALVRLVDVASASLLAMPWASRRPEISRSLLPLASQALKGTLIALGAVTILSELGFPVSSLLAGLGIGGVAIALAGQKTVENLFGAFSLGVDQPFRLGDWVNVEGQVSGTVERTGMRSTRIRTAERTLVTIPNGKLAEMRLETFAARDRFLFSTKVGLVYGTTATQLRAVVSGIEQVLDQQPTVHRESRVVRFSSLGPSSLDLEVVATFTSTTFEAFRDVRQEVLLGILEAVEREGASLAFPTQTIQLEDGRRDGRPARAGEVGTAPTGAPEGTSREGTSREDTSRQDTSRQDTSRAAR